MTESSIPAGFVAPNPYERPPLVIVSPYPSAKNGIAAYVAELMPYHLAEFDVTLVIADDAPEPIISPAGPRVLLASEFRKHRSFFETAPKVYHFGNNPDHCYMFDLISVAPGLVVLHDYVLNYLHDASMIGWREPEGYPGAHELEYGLLGSKGVREQYERENRGQFATYELTLNGDVLEAATGVIAHSRYAQYKVAARVPHTPVWYVPHHLTPVVEEFAGLSKAEARKQLGLPGQELIVSALGFFSYAKRIPLLLHALSQLRSRVPPFRLVLAGEKRPREYDVDADIDACALRDVTTCTGYVDEMRFFQYLRASDIVSNLRHPSGGESSGTLIRALGMGAAVLVLDNGPMGELPDSVVAKVPWDDATQASVTAKLQELLSNAPLRTAMSQRAAAYANSHHGIRSVAQRYSNIIRKSADRPQSRRGPLFVQHFPHPKDVARSIRQAGPSISAATEAADGRVWWRCGTAPLGQIGHRAIVISPRPAPTAKLLSTLFGWEPESITEMTPAGFLEPKLRDADGTALRMASFDFVLLVTPPGMPENRAAALIRRLNAALQMNGTLVVEIVTDLDREATDEPLAEGRLPQRLIDGGFSVVRTAVPQEGIFSDLVVEALETPEELRRACVTARKASTFSLWRHTLELNGIPGYFGGRVG
ncbi:MAG TPA: glycosyltransferase [Rhizomicrobium sp.]|jgi:glycosyltransferase involved in cell wall biosynthesis|nr:glycosyltransferase [Rhizomicrobium sp.]